jgi:type IV pilus assembly protein PilC
LNFRLSQALSLLLSSRITISEAITICTEVMDNSIVRKDLLEISAKVNSGEAFWQSLDGVPYINPLFVSLAQVGEDTGSLPHTIHKCSAYCEESYKHSVRRLNKLIEPLITLILGVLLAAVMISIILPTFELATAI